MKLLFVGDVMLGRVVNEVLGHTAPDYPWGDTLPTLGLADWRACNLECVISNRGEPWSATPKAFHFRSDRKNLAVLKAARIDAVSLANNHVLDFGYGAMFEALELLERAGIGHAGAGRDLKAASAPALCEVKGKKIGLLAFTDNEPEWEAGTHTAGVWYVPIDATDARAQFLFDTIRRIRTNVDILIVSAHWGPNWGYEPLAAHVKFAHRLVDLGTDVIFGHSGHVFRGIEVYRQRPIMYCTGDFIDDYAVDETERNDESFIFSIDTDNGHLDRLTLRPTVIADCRAELAPDDWAGDIALKMLRLCGKLGSDAHWDRSRKLLKIAIR